MIMADFSCDSCPHVFEDLVSSGTTTVPCPMCGKDAQKQMSAPRIALYNTPETKAAALRKRSEEHTKKEVAREPEKFKMRSSRKPWNVRGARGTK